MVRRKLVLLQAFNSENPKALSLKSLRRSSLTAQTPNHYSSAMSKPFLLPQAVIRKMHLNLEVLLASSLQAVVRKKPVLHAFGHIHEGYGVRANSSTYFVNSAARS